MRGKWPPDMKIAIIGGGVISGGWAARFLLNGHDVAVYNPSLDAAHKLEEVLGNARASLLALYDRPLPLAGRLFLAGSVTDADWVQERPPERLEIKQALYAQIESHLTAHAVLASSTSGYKPSQLRKLCQRPERLIVAHPFNPVYLVPRVESVGSDRTPEPLKRRAADILRGIGMHPLVLRGEVEGFIGNRLQEAVWRKALRMIRDTAIRAQEPQLPFLQDGDLPVTARWVIPPTWIDANGHMNEAYYVEVASNAADTLTESRDVTADCIAGGNSHFTAETHVRYPAALHAGDAITVRTRVLHVTGKKTHLFHHIEEPNGELAATVEMLILHAHLPDPDGTGRDGAGDPRSETRMRT